MQQLRASTVTEPRIRVRSRMTGPASSIHEDDDGLEIDDGPPWNASRDISLSA